VTDVLDASGRFDLETARTLRVLKKLKCRSRTGTAGRTLRELEVEIHDPIAAVMQIARIKRLV
jgi:hypothetical protein